MQNKNVEGVHKSVFGDRLNISTNKEHYEETKKWVYEQLEDGGYINNKQWRVVGTAPTDVSTNLSSAFSKYGSDDEEMVEVGTKEQEDGLCPASQSRLHME